MGPSTIALDFVEVLSPSTARSDRHRKRKLYKSEAAPAYSIFDPAACFAERWRPGDAEPENLMESLTWQHDADPARLAIDVAAKFRCVHGE